MASVSTVQTIHLPAVLQRKLDVGSVVENLEQRAAALEKQFKAILEKAQELLCATTRYVDKQETEFECWRLLEKILTAGGDSRDILDHVRVFFQLVLAQMKINGADIRDVKMLWHLHDNEGVHAAFVTAVNHFGFGTQDLHNLKVLLALTYKLQVDMERDVSDGLIDADVTDSVLDCDMVDRFYLENKELEHVLKESRSMLGNLTTDSMQNLLCYVQDKAKHAEGKTDNDRDEQCNVQNNRSSGDATEDVKGLPSTLHDKPKHREGECDYNNSSHQSHHPGSGETTSTEEGKESTNGAHIVNHVGHTDHVESAACNPTPVQDPQQAPVTDDGKEPTNCVEIINHVDGGQEMNGKPFDSNSENLNKATYVNKVESSEHSATEKTTDQPKKNDIIQLSNVCVDKSTNTCNENEETQKLQNSTQTSLSVEIQSESIVTETMSTVNAELSNKSPTSSDNENTTTKAIITDKSISSINVVTQTISTTADTSVKSATNDVLETSNSVETTSEPDCLDTQMKPGCLETPMKSVTTNLTTPLRAALKPLPDKSKLKMTLHTWGVDQKMQETVLKIMYTVLWVLNVGRKDKNLSIHNH